MSLGNIIKAGCLQLCSTEDIETNLNQIKSLLQENTQQNLDILLLPENATLLTSNKALRHQAAQSDIYLKIFDFFSLLAIEYQTWIVAGSLLVQDEDNPKKYFNQCPVFSPDGQLHLSYNKIHLFDADLGSESWCESETISRGDSPSMFSFDNNWKIGLSICYDLRFPELYRYYSEQNCNIMSVPSAFTVPTGKVHWETLLKTRAIENQSYVLAAGQHGLHQEGRTTYGHSMIIDPWGETLSQIEAGEGLITSDLDLNKLLDIRKRLPALKHRRLV